MAILALEDGTLLEGEGFGANADAVFELVFNTSMTGYQEILSDPSYLGQGVLFTTSHVGNVGINVEDCEAEVPQAEAVVIRSLSHAASSWRSRLDLSGWLAQNGVPGISGVDTRFLTRKLREQGTLKAALSTSGTPAGEVLAAARGWPGLDLRDMVQAVTCKETTVWHDDPGSAWVPRRYDREVCVVVLDCGVKRNILRWLASYGARVVILPAYSSIDDIQRQNPAGVLLSNGPGDPAGLPGIVETTHRLIESGMPVFGICLGHQLIARALGGETRRLKFGHHSGNHPVQDLRSRKVLVTAQNHNFTVAPESLDPKQVEITQISLNDHTVEGMRLRDRPVFSVQFHPEGAPGPHDAQGLFDTFFAMVDDPRPKEG